MNYPAVASCGILLLRNKKQIFLLGPESQNKKI